MTRWFIPLCLIVALSACNDTTEPSPIKLNISQTQNLEITEDKPAPDTSNSEINLQQVKQQYAGIILSIQDASVQNYQDKPALMLSLSVPLNPEHNHQANLQVMDDDEKLINGAWQLSDNGRQLYFSAIEADSHYHVKVFPSLTAATGVKLPELFSVELKTEPAQAAVSFTTQKTVLVANEAKGLAISAINIPNVDIDFFRIDLKQYPQFENSWYERSQNKGSWELKRALKYSKPVYSGRFELDLPRNTRKTLYIDTASIDALQPAGFYLAVMKAASTYPNEYSTATFIVSDLGLHARLYDQAMHVYTSSLTNAKAKPRVEIKVMDDKGNTLVTQLSDEQGIARFESLPKGSQYIIGQIDKQIGLLNLQDAALDLSEFTLTKELAGNQSLFIYSPRDLYRPGETVDLFALLRNLDGSLAPVQPLNARLLQADGQELKSFQWQPQDQASYQYQLQLPKTAQTGLWSFEVELANKFTQRFTFHVEDFLPERLNLLFADNDPQNPQIVFHDQPLTVKVTGEFLYGAPAAGNTLETFIQPELLTEPFKQLPGFQFGYLQDTDNLQNAYLDDQQLNDEGIATIQSENLAKNTQSPVQLKISASLLESGGRPVTRYHRITSFPAKKMVGIHPLYENGLDHFEANTLASFEIVKVSPQLEYFDASELQVKLIHERRDYHWINRGAGWSYEFNEKHITAFENKFAIAAGQQRGEIKLPLEWGQYRIEITDPETKLTTSTRFQAGSSWWGEQDQQAQGTRPDQIKLSWDKASYQAGDNAQLTLVPPYAGEGFIVVESDKPLWGQRFSLPQQGLTISIPISEEWNRPDIYATAVIFRPSSQVDLITPKRALGLLHLPINHVPQHIEVEINSPDKIEPNKKLKVQLQAAINGEKINNQPLQLRLMAVDVGILNITSFKTPDPFAWMFKPRRLRVEAHDMYGDIVEYLKADLARQKFGGDEDLAQGGEQAKADVQIVSILHPLVNFDENGQAELELDIPDFNGRLRLMAVAFGDSQFGASEKEINVAAPIIAEIAMPRFISRNDQAHITLELQNLTEQQQKINTVLNTSDPLTISGINQYQLTLAPKQRELLHYQLSAEAFGKGEIRLKLNNEDNSIQLERHWGLTSRSPYPAESFNSNRVLAQGESITLQTEITNKLIQTGTAGSLIVSDKPPVDISAHVDNLLQYPYGCLEQTSSRIYPLLYADKQAIERWQLDQKEWTQQKRFQQIDHGLTHISGMQLNNGGFGLWDNNSQEEFWLTAYVSHLLLDAEKQGIDIPKTQQKKALQRLAKYIKTPLPLMGDDHGEIKSAFRFAYKAYAAYVLSLSTQAPIAQLRKLYDYYQNQTDSILPMLHIAIALQQQGDQKRATAALQKAGQIKRSDSYLADYGSQIRDLAMANYLMLKHQLNIPKQNWLFELGNELRNKKWLSTQERNSLFLLGQQLDNNDNQSWHLQLSIGNDSINIQAKGKKQRLLTWQLLQQQISLLNTNDYDLYSLFRITGYPQAAPANMASGMSVNRRYYNKSGAEISLDLIRQGELVVVNLSLESDSPHPDSLLVDMLPAGFEIENQNLANSVSLDSIQINGKSIKTLERDSNILHRESLDDRFIAAVNINKYQSANLFYLMRAVTPGIYQVPATLAEDMYRPEFRSVFNNEQSQVTIYAR